jgi:hypothetical protein
MLVCACHTMALSDTKYMDNYIGMWSQGQHSYEGMRYVLRGQKHQKVDAFSFTSSYSYW